MAIASGTSEILKIALGSTEVLKAAIGATDVWAVATGGGGGGGTFLADRYISPSGSNNNSGTITSPWLTPQYGWNNIGAGQVLAVRAGTYTASGTTTPVLTTSSGGSNSSSGMKRMVAYPNEARPLFRGGFFINSNYSAVEGIDINAGSSYWTADLLPLGFARGSNSVTGSGLRQCYVTTGNATNRQGILMGGSTVPTYDCFFTGCIFHNITGTQASGPHHGIYEQNGEGLFMSGCVFYRVGWDGSGAGYSGSRALQIYPKNVGAVMEYLTFHECNGGIVSAGGSPNGDHVLRKSIFSTLNPGSNGRDAYSTDGNHTLAPTQITNCVTYNAFALGGDVTVSGTTSTNPAYTNPAALNFRTAIADRGAFASATPPWT